MAFTPDTVTHSEIQADIADDLAEAIEQHEADAPATEPAEARSEPARAEPAESAKKSESDSKSEKPAAAKDTKQSEPVRPARAPAALSWPDRNPDIFNRLPQEGRKYFRDLEADNKKMTSEVRAYKRDWEPVMQMLEPHRKAMADRGFTPEKLIKGWVDAETRIVRGEGATFVADVIRSFNIDPNQVFRALQGPVRQGPSAAAMDEARRQHTVSEAQVNDAIEAFKATAPHFAELEQEMADLARGGVGAGKPLEARLQELYDRASWMNRKTRAVMLKARQSSAPQVQPRVPSRASSVRDDILGAMGTAARR